MITVQQLIDKLSALTDEQKRLEVRVWLPEELTVVGLSIHVIEHQGTVRLMSSGDHYGQT